MRFRQKIRPGRGCVAIPIPFYRCEKCRREHDSREGAEQCEASHHRPVSVEIKQYTHRPYPYALNVTFEDGAVKVYNAEDMGG